MKNSEYANFEITGDSILFRVATGATARKAFTRFSKNSGSTESPQNICDVPCECPI